jgi:hypothetical protein
MKINVYALPIFIADFDIEIALISLLRPNVTLVEILLSEFK